MNCQGIIALNVLPLGWGAAGDLIDYFGYDSTHEVACALLIHVTIVTCGVNMRAQVKQTVMFLWLMLTYSTFIELPWAVYMTFVLEERHGFNKQVSYVMA